MDSSESKAFLFPILIGEFKHELDWKVDPDYLQLMNYHLTVQRPYSLIGDRAHLLGFVMDFDAAYIFDYEVGYWTDYSFVQSTTQIFCNVTILRILLLVGVIYNSSLLQVNWSTLTNLCFIVLVRTKYSVFNAFTSSHTFSPICRPNCLHFPMMIFH